MTEQDREKEKFMQQMVGSDLLYIDGKHVFGSPRVDDTDYASTFSNLIS